MAAPFYLNRPGQAALFSVGLIAVAALVVALAKSLLFPDLGGFWGAALLALLIITVAGLLVVRFLIWPLFARDETPNAAEAYISSFGDLDHQLADVTNEQEVIDVLRKALPELDLPGLVEVHVIGGLADELHFVAANTDQVQPPKPASPWDPRATNEGQTVTFADSSGDDACPHLATRITEPCSAVSIPLVAQNGILGVLHATGPVDEPPTQTAVIILEALASRAALHIALQRSAAEAWRDHLDPVTSLPLIDDVERRLSLADTASPQAVGALTIANFSSFLADHGPGITGLACRWIAGLLLSTFGPGSVVGTDGRGSFVVTAAGSAGEMRAKFGEIDEHVGNGSGALAEVEFGAAAQDVESSSGPLSIQELLLETQTPSRR